MSKSKAATHILGNVIVQLDVLHLVPVKILGKEEGQHNSEDEGDEEAEAAASQGRANLL